MLPKNIFFVGATLAVAPESRLVTIFMSVVIQGREQALPLQTTIIFRRKIVSAVADLEHRKMLQYSVFPMYDVQVAERQRGVRRTPPT
jgi:hypothetical protein